MWFYNEKEFKEEDIGNAYGYVYLITNLTNNRKYIGKKFFTKAGYKTVKGKRKKIRKASDWLEYYGSNEELKNEVKSLGETNFRREILHLCASKSECSYRETYEIFTRGALLTEDYYNSWVTCKIHKAHVFGKL